MGTPANQNLDHLIESFIDVAQRQAKEARSSNLVVGKITSKCLLIKSHNVVSKILCDTLRIYSYLSHDEPNLDLQDSRTNSLIQLITLPPAKSYLNLAFQQLFEFLSKELNSCNETVIENLIDFAEQLRETFRTLCPEDRKALKPSGHHKFSEVFIEELAVDAIYLMSWSSIEAAKRIIDSCEKASSIKLARFLTLLSARLTVPVAFGSKVFKGYMIELIQNMDKILFTETTHPIVGDKKPDESKSSINSDHLICIKWLFQERQNIARLSLLIDNPAECWRNVNNSLSFSLTQDSTKLFDTNVISSSNESENWLSLMSTLASSARQLQDNDLLFGVETVLKMNIPSTRIPSIKCVRDSLNGSYQKILEESLSSEIIDEASNIEFLNSCIELNTLEDFESQLSKIELESTRELYYTYLNSKNGATVEDMRHWLKTWTETPQELNSVPMKDKLNLIIPSCLNNIVKSPEKDQVMLIACVEELLSVELMIHSLTYPLFVNIRFKVYETLLILLKGNFTEFEKLVEIHKKDLHWNQLCYRYIEDLNLCNTLRHTSDDLACVMDLIQLRAAKYHHKKNNIHKAKTIVESLSKHASHPEHSILGSFLKVKMHPDSIEDGLKEIYRSIKVADFDHNIIMRGDLMAKRCRNELRYQVKGGIEGFYKAETGQDVHVDANPVRLWSHILDNASRGAQIKTLSLFSAKLKDQLDKQPNCPTTVKSSFDLDVKLLRLLCNSIRCRDKSSAIECAVRLIDKVVLNDQVIEEENLKVLSSPNFLTETIDTWTSIRNNLISIATNSDDLSDAGYSVLSEILKFITLKYPDLMIYSIVVNRLDSQVESTELKEDGFSQSTQDPSSLLHESILPSYSSLESTNSNSKRRLTLWNDIYDSLLKQDNKWLEKYNDTERFIIELRRISFLCGEHCEKMLLQLTRALYKLRDTYERACTENANHLPSKQDSSSLLDLSKTLCKRTLKEVRTLIAYAQHCKRHSMNIYDETFSNTFIGRLGLLKSSLNDLYLKESFTICEIHSVTAILYMAIDFQHELKLFNDKGGGQNLCLRMISPILFELKSDLIPMPDTSLPRTPNVTIHSIGNTVNLIKSLHNPKKLKFTGSDGVNRAFLLKAHEDLRQDQLVMDLFSTIDCLLAGDKEIQNNYRIRRYVVTPVSSRSGLIQYIEAVSMNTLYQDWLNGASGRERAKDLYRTTCEVVCEYGKEHENCIIPQRLQGSDLFYQLIWSLTNLQSRPGFANWRELRATLDASVFQRVVQQLAANTPRDLISRHFWLKSRNAYALWLKTQNFIRSCAIMSMVGYVIGLEDRHTGNILVDCNTGEVIHIDYGICFESAPSPESVPFRLTQNLVHGFGYAGLEGGFTLSCRRVLNLLRRSRSVIEHLLHPVNLAFMIDPSMEQATRNSKLDAFNVDTRVSPNKLNRDAADDLEMCSQESVVLDPIKKQQRGIDELLILVTDPQKPDTDHGTNLSQSRRRMKSSNIESDLLIEQPPNGLHLQIKAPKKISMQLAINRHSRIKDKLAGTDEQLRQNNHRRDQLKQLLLDCKIDHEPGMDKIDESDLIVLNDTQTVEEQVDALISDSKSISNLAAMYEGWKAWV